MPKKYQEVLNKKGGSNGTGRTLKKDQGTQKGKQQEERAGGMSKKKIRKCRTGKNKKWGSKGTGRMLKK